MEKNKQNVSSQELAPAVLLPDGGKIYQAIKKDKAISVPEKIEHVRSKLYEFYSSEDAQKVPLKEAFKKHSALRYGDCQDNEDKRNLFLTLVAGYLLIKCADNLVQRVKKVLRTFSPR